MMKKAFSICWCMCLVLMAVWGTTGARSPTAFAADTFSVSGTAILKNGSEFVIKGVNVNGPNWVWPRETTQDAGLIGDVWKFNTVRVQAFIDPVNGSYTTNNDLNNIVNAFTSRGIVVIIEPHDKTGNYFTDSSTPSLTDLVNWHKGLANAYKNNPYVWFNVQNEPGYGGAIESQYLTTNLAVIQGIRSTGANNIIVVDGGSWGQDTGVWNSNPVPEGNSGILTYGEQLKNADSTGNIVFSVHMYDQWTYGDSRFQDYVTRVHNKNLALIIGEYGPSNDGQTLNVAAAVDTALNVAIPNRIGRIAWHWDGGDANDLTTGTSQGGGWEINDTSGAKPSNLSAFGNKIWDDNHNGNLLQNGDFASGTSPWNLSLNGATASFSNSNGVGYINISDGGDDIWRVTLSQNFDTPLVAGRTYTIKFDAKAGSNRTVNAVLTDRDTGYTYWAAWSVSLGTNMTTYRYSFTPSSNISNLQFGIRMGSSNSSVYLDNISIQ